MVYNIHMDINRIKAHISPVLKKYGVIRASLFGSALHKPLSEAHDVDLLVELPKDRTGLDFVGYYMDLKDALEDKIQKKVDLVQYHLIKKNLKPYIEKDQQVIYSSL